MHFAHEAGAPLVRRQSQSAKLRPWLRGNLGFVTFFRRLSFDDRLVMATDATPKAARLIVVIDTSALEPGNC